MVTIRLRTPQHLTLNGFRRLCLRGEVVTVAPEIAERLIGDGRAIPVELPDEQGATSEDAVPAFDDLTVEQLQALADERGLTVEGTGSNGKVLKGDLVTALTEAGAAA